MFKLWEVLFLTVFSALASIVLYVLTMFAISDNAIEYCYIEAESVNVPIVGTAYTEGRKTGMFSLYGKRSWTAKDNISYIGTFPTILEAKSSAEIIGCPLNGMK